jgi:hypothetical protein
MGEMNASHAHCANTLINVGPNKADSSMQNSLICTPLTFHVFVYCHELIMIGLSYVSCFLIKSL